jgi:hypothetical protein
MHTGLKTRHGRATASRIATAAALSAAALLAGTAAQATVVFADDFEGPFGAWSAGGTAKPNDAVLSGDYTHQGGGALFTFIGADGDGNAYGGESVWGSLDISLAAGGDYSLSLWTAANLCSDCSYDVQFDGVSVASGVLGANWAQVSQGLTGLSAGLHTLQVGITLGASAVGLNGAYFDDITLTSVAPPVNVPEPTSLLLAGAAVALLAAQRRRSTAG